MTLFDGETGQTIAVMNASPITAIRTAAASALATRELAREDARVLAIVGAGFQAKAHLRALAEVREFDDIRIASRTLAKAEALAEEHPAARATDSIEDAVRGADVIVTVTSSAEPVIDREWLTDGAHINAVGACFPHTRELDSATVADSTLDRRQPRVGRERVGRLPHRARRRRDRRRAHRRGAGGRPRGNASGAHVSRRDHGVRVPRHRRGRPLRGRVRRRRARESGRGITAHF